MEGNDNATAHDLESLVANSRLRAIKIVAWRDLDDPEAGGSELHAHRIAALWAQAGLDVTMRTSQVPNAPEEVTRDGYRSIRKNGRYSVFPHVMAEGIRTRSSGDTALVEIWNGMPFLSPLWHRGPRIVFLHHVHAEMWNMVLSPRLAAGGKFFEGSLAPLLYRSSTVVTLSESSRDEICASLKLPEDRVIVIPPGIDPRFQPGGTRSSDPSVVAVGRLVPFKRFDDLIRHLVEVKTTIPNLRASIIGEGYERANLEKLRDELGASSWLELPGRLSDVEQLDAYRSAWVVASTSGKEGWGMTLTEAAACGTPGIATDIPGHRDAIQDGQSGILVGSDASFAESLREVLINDQLRATLSEGALTYAQTLTWDRTAADIFALLSESVPSENT
jgi:glycosyltransferase involved in cell wall biosynthesis